MKKMEINDQPKSFTESKNYRDHVIGVNCMFIKLDKCQYLGSASSIFNRV